MSCGFVFRRLIRPTVCPSIRHLQHACMNHTWKHICSNFWFSAFVWGRGENPVLCLGKRGPLIQNASVSVAANIEQFPAASPPSPLASAVPINCGLNFHFHFEACLDFISEFVVNYLIGSWVKRFWGSKKISKAKKLN